MSQIVIAYPFEIMVIQNDLKVLCDVIWFDAITDRIDVDSRSFCYTYIPPVHFVGWLVRLKLTGKAVSDSTVKMRGNVW